MVNRKPGLITAVGLIVFSLLVMLATFSPVRATILRQAAVLDSYMIINLSVLDEAATVYFLKPTSGLAAMRYHKDLGYFDLSVDDGSTWNRVTTEDIDNDTTDHGALTGLADDDHSQYFPESEHLNSSAGAGDAGKPIVLDAAGHVDASMINDADVSHLNIADIGTNAHSVVDTHLADTADPHSTVSDTHPPTLTEAFSGSHTFDYLEYFNGTIFEVIDVVITESAGTVSLELQAEGGGDLTLNFSDGHHAFDSTPAATVALTAGTDTVPVRNFVYILASNDTLTVSIVGWPDAEHAPIADVILQSAATTATDEPLKAHVWTNDIKDGNGEGHSIHISERIRGLHAEHVSGMAPTLTFDTVPEPDTAIFTVTAGVGRQLHKHSSPAFTGTPDIRVVNEPGTPFNVITDLNELTQDSAGNAFTNNTFFTVTMSLVLSEDLTQCKLFLTLPSGTYGNITAALADSSGYTNTSVPSDYKGAILLLARYTLKYQTIGSGTFSLVAGGAVDLRGQPPGTSTGGGAGGSPLTVEEQDASPSVADVNTIKFPNGAVTDDGGGIVSITVGGTPGGADTQVQYNDGGIFAGDAGLSYDDTLNLLYAAGGVYSQMFRVLNDAGTFFIDIEADPLLAANYRLRLPPTEGATGKYLKIDSILVDALGRTLITSWTTPAGSGDMTKAVYDTDTNSIVDEAEAIPYVTSGNVTVAEGQMVQKSHEDAFAVNGGGTGQVQGEAQKSILDTIDYPMNPGVKYASDTDVRLIEIGLEAPHGFKIVRWSVDFGMDPDVELDADLCYADDWAETNETVIDVLDTTAGTSSETTPANINGGVAIPTGKRVYIRINADPTGTGVRMSFRLQGYGEED